MQRYFLLALGAALVNNVVLVKLIGLCPVLGVSRRLHGALTLGLATAFTLTVVTGLSYLINEYVLAPLEIEYARLLVFMTLIAVAAALVTRYVRASHPLLHDTLGILLPLTAINCAALGVPLINLQEKNKFVESLFMGLGSGIGFVLVLVLFASLRERLEGANVPAAFRGNAIALVTAGLMSLGFMGFYGLVK
jgi:Na+-translocating ferredoxin:NAD+ oxidoreductase subunit A